MNRCELTRWHPFKAGADMPKNCVKPAGHDGMCRDYRGDYEGSPGRAREMTPEEVNAHNLSDDAEEGTKDVCSTRRPGYQEGPAWGRRRLPCVREVDHEGVHANAFGDTWTDTDVVDHPMNDSAREAGRIREVTPEECASPRCILPSGHTGAHAEHPEPFVVNACAAQLASLLTAPGLLRDAAETLHKAATVWETLDTLIRTGGPLPSRWATPRVDSFLAGIDATPLHSTLTESLDTSPPGGGYRVMPFTTLRAAVHTWDALDTVLCGGGALPEPWAEVAR
ncbi:hypothetical protein ACWGKS_26410 [Nocardiopsis sp. NPDC055879]